MAAKAAVLRQHQGAMKIEPVEISSPGPGEVLVKIKACGICHTDMVMRDGLLPVPTPVVLGHEGAGEVVEVGDGVTHVCPGDHVVMSFASCGGCPSCVEHDPAYCHQFFPLNFFAVRPDGTTAITAGGEPVHSHVFGQSSFATYAVASGTNVVKVPADLPLEVLAPLGCGIQTGVGAVLNSLDVRAGSSVLVMGTGAVGMSAIMAARIAGAARILAMDLSADRLALASELGATDILHPDGKKAVLELVQGAGLEGVDYIVDTTGVPPLLAQAVPALNIRGVLGLVAAYPPGEKLDVEMAFMMSGGRRIQGVVEGSSDPQDFIPKLIAWYRSGLLPIDRMMKFYDFADISTAIEDGESGKVIKPVLVMS
ncbi:NAD(P)-dependent alcohol dehydrogenase [Kordiimonas marina]|uniref:NAD(P)-dependent alcohol dehydrogenase n=1 Tax=Kordiimonas marina TaxID=2872312 RepID=UPI003CCFE8D1